MKVHVLGKWTTAWQNGKLIYEEAKRQKFNVSLGVLEQPHKEILKAIDREKPDWVFLTGSRTLPVEIMQEIANRAKLLLWDADGNSEERRVTWAERLHIPDIIITSVLEIKNEYIEKCKRIEWMPQYFDNVYYQSSKQFDNPEFDIVFLGGTDTRRKEALEYLAQQFKVGYHWHMFGSNMVDAYHNAKIAIGIHRNQALKNLGDFITSDRIYKAMGCGIFYLSHPIDKIELLFKPGVHLDVHDRSFENMAEKVRYWLDHEKARKEIAKAGQDEILKNHTLKVRIKQYWQLMEDPNYTPPFEKGLL